MTAPEDDPSLRLSDVHERFRASSVALEGLEQQLSTLTTLADEREAATSSMQQAGTQLRWLIEEMKEVVQTLKDAQTTAASAFNSAHAVLDGTDLKALKVGLDEIQSRLTEVESGRASEASDTQQQLERQASTIAALEARLAELDKQEELRAENDQLKAEVKALAEKFERARGAIRAGRWKSLGLDNE